MNEYSNPYIHLSERYLKRRIRQYTKVLNKIVTGRAAHLDFNANRAMLLTFAEALNTKKSNDYFNVLLSSPSSSGDLKDG